MGSHVAEHRICRLKRKTSGLFSRVSSMGPKRKKSKPNPEDEQSVQATASKVQPTSNIQQSSNETRAPTDTSQSSPATAKVSPVPSRSTWYNSSWRSKASPVASVARESISVAQGATSESSENTRPPASISKSLRGSRKSIPLAAEATRVHATSDASNKARPSSSIEEKPKVVESESKGDIVMEDAPLPPVQPVVEAPVDPTKAQQGGWFGWWSRPDGYGSDPEKVVKKQKLDVEEASRTPLPGTPVLEHDDPMKKNARDFEGIGGTTEQPKQDDKQQPLEMAQQQQSSRSWFGLWSSTQNEEAVKADQTIKDESSNVVPDITVSSEPSKPSEGMKTAELLKPDVNPTEAPPKSSGWAFWSSDKSKDPAPTPGGTQKQVGELAVADTPSQSKPEAAQFNEQRQDPEPASKPKRAGSLLKPKPRRPDRSTAKESSGNESSSAAPSPPVEISPVGPSPATSQIPSPSETPPPEQMQASSILSRIPEPRPTSKQSKAPPNLVLPHFYESFPAAPNPGYMERLTTYLAQSLYIPGSQPQSHPQHVFRSASPPKIKKAVALGIHGFFPGALIQKFLGQPRGTSVRLSNYAATAIKHWCHEHQPDTKDAVEIEKVALEGEGYVADRVSTLWKLLLNWLNHLRQADFILVACHSQGVPVAMTLVAKLIQLGALKPNIRLGLCAMAGINLGPFLEYRSRWFSGTALELFDFCESNSKVSRAYAESVEICLRHGVRITFVGSIDDQLVSLESALHMPLTHPYVNRAVFIDGRIHAPNFLTHLVAFALRLRNLGVSDHGLVRELSAPLAGSLVGGEGHSRVYDDPQVYRLAVDFALESTDVLPTAAQVAVDAAKKDPSIPTSPAVAENLRRTSLSTATNTIQPTSVAPTFAAYEPPPTSANTNPFVLPWAVRGMLEEELVKREMKDEVEELVREFEAWKPTSKVLRDVRWRLEGVRGMM